MGIQNYIVSSLLVGLCILSFMFWSYQISQDNSARNIMGESSLNKSFVSLLSKMNQTQRTAQAQLNATSSENPIVAYGSLILFSITTAVRIFTGTVTGIYDTFATLISETLGINYIIIGVFNAIILIILILLGWRLYRSGY